MHSESTRDSIRVVYVVFERSGGMRHYAAALSSAMAAIADSSLVIPQELEGIRVSNDCFMTKLTKKYNPLYYCKIADIIVRQYKPDIVHITSKSIGLLPFIVRLRYQGIQVVYTLHDPVPHEQHNTHWGKLVERYHYSCEMRWILRTCSATHVHSEDHRSKLRRKYGDSCVDKIYVVQHGGGATEAIISGREVPDALRENNDIFTFLFFGRIEPYKGLSILLSAFEKLVPSYPGCRLVIAGAGVLKESIRLPAYQYVLLNRFIEDSEIRWILECASVVVLPYLSATQSGVIPLAYEFSRPVICSDIGGLPEMVIAGQTGLIVSPGDVDALVDAMRMLVVDRKVTRKMGEKARTYMTEHFSWNTVVKQHRAKYATLLEEKKIQRG